MPTQKLGLMQKATRLEARGLLAEGKRKVHALAPGVTWLCECQAKRIASLSPGLQKSPKPKASLQCPSPRQEGHSQSHVGTTWTPSAGSCHQGTLTGLPSLVHATPQGTHKTEVVPVHV